VITLKYVSLPSECDLSFDLYRHSRYTVTKVSEGSVTCLQNTSISQEREIKATYIASVDRNRGCERRSTRWWTLNEPKEEQKRREEYQRSACVRGRFVGSSNAPVPVPSFLHLHLPFPPCLFFCPEHGFWRGSSKPWYLSTKLHCVIYHKALKVKVSFTL